MQGRRQGKGRRGGWGDEHWTRKAKAQGLRARSAFKLEELQRRYRLLRPGMAVLDLGAAPGGFAQVAARLCGAAETSAASKGGAAGDAAEARAAGAAGAKEGSPRGLVLAIDLQPVAPIYGVDTLQADLCGDETPALVLEYLRERGRPAFDLILSDMAPSLTGIADADQAAAARLWRAALELASRGTLRPGGSLLVKTFAGPAQEEFLGELRRSFAKVRTEHSPVTRAASREVFQIARGFRPDALAVAPEGAGEN